MFASKITYAFIALYGLAIVIPIQKHQVEMGGMKMDYKIEDNEMTITLAAPTEGWLAVGFNDKNDIVHSDLLMFAIKDEQIIAEDRYVKGFRDYPIDEEQGGTTNIEVIKGKETKKGTTVTFKIPLQSGDEKDFQHQANKDVWLILAYSTSDDFQHHSVMRKHRKVRLKIEN